MRCALPLALLASGVQALRFDERPAASDASLHENLHRTGAHYGEDALKAARSRSSTMQLHMMPDKGLNGTGEAVCLDGSDAGFYFSKASSPEHANNWIIYFGGGSWCYGDVDCWQRSNMELGSSKEWMGWSLFGGIMSDDCTTSPDLCNFNRVHLMYCDGFAFAGDREEPWVVPGLDGKQRALYFRGKRNMEAALTKLLDMGLRNAKQVLITGCSSGGLAAFLHSNYIHKLLKGAGAPLTRFKTAPLSGFFVSHPSVEGKRNIDWEFESAVNVSHGIGSLDPRCVADMKKGEEWKCAFPKYAAAYIDTPVFTINSNKDWNQLACTLAARIKPVWHSSFKTACTDVRGWTMCVNNPEMCSESQLWSFNNFSQDFNEDVFRGPKSLQKHGNGAFVHSCHTHCEAQDNQAWASFKVGGVTMRQAFSKWWNADERTEFARHTYKDCALYHTKQWPHRCNPTCLKIG